MGMGRSRSQAGARPVSQPPTPGAGPLTVMVKMYSTKFHKGLLESAPKHSLGCRQLRRPKWELKIGEEAVQLLNRGSVWRQLKRATVRFKGATEGQEDQNGPAAAYSFLSALG